MATALLGRAIATMPGFKGELRKMEVLVRDIEALLADAETSKQSENPIVLRCLKNFKGGVTLEAEIVLDELLYQGLRLKVRSLFSSLSFRLRMRHRARGINAMKQKPQILEFVAGRKRLTLSNFMGVRFPGWLGKLVSLQLKECRNITQLGSSGDGGFPNLKTLHIWRCPQMSSAPTSFPVLEDLHVENIKVSGARDIISTAANSLRCLWLEGVSGMNSLSDVTESSSLPSCLNKLSIVFCEDLREIPSPALECCTSLESLQVWGCRELVSFPLNLQQTPSLSRITLWGCQKLFMNRDAALPRGFEHLTNLKELRIWLDESIDWDGLKRGCSTTLRELVMYRSHTILY